MDELEEKINKVLSSPEELSRIMQLARSFAGTPDESVDTSNAGTGQNSGGIDPMLLLKITRLVSELNSQAGSSSALLSALSPYLSENRRQKVQKAAQIAKIAKIARTAFSEMGEMNDL